MEYVKEFKMRCTTHWHAYFFVVISLVLSIFSFRLSAAELPSTDKELNPDAQSLIFELELQDKEAAKETLITARLANSTKPTATLRVSGRQQGQIQGKIQATVIPVMTGDSNSDVWASIDVSEINLLEMASTAKSQRIVDELEEALLAWRKKLSDDETKQVQESGTLVIDIGPDLPRIEGLKSPTPVNVAFVIPVITDIVSMPSLTLIGHPDPVDNVALLSYLSAVSDNKPGRFLLIYGHHLINAGPTKVISASGIPIEYVTLGHRSPEYGCSASLHPDTGYPGARWLWDALWSDVPSGQDDNVDGIMVRAKMLAGILPGFKKLSVRGAEGSWYKEKGTDNATVRFVIDDGRIAKGVETTNVVSTDVVFISQHLRVEVQVTWGDTDIIAEYPFTEISTNEKHEDRTIQVVVGASSSTVENEEVLILNATRVPMKPSTYRTEIIRIEQKGQALEVKRRDPELHYILGEDGDSLMATIEPNIFATEPEMAVATIRRQPSDLGTLWNDTVKDAAKADKVDVSKINILDLPYEKAGELSRLVLVDLGYRRVPVLIGDQAAMLLLRDTFVELMKGYKETLPQIKDEAMLLVVCNAYITG